MRQSRKFLSAQRAMWLALALCAGSASPALAQFYSLEGRFQCLNDPHAVCYDAVSDWPVAKPKAPAESGPSTPPKPQVAQPLPAATVAAAPLDPVLAVARRLQHNATAPGDIELLRSRARGGDTRAIELLAWSNLTGIGVSPDPVQAYLLYGTAATLGVANARRNQAVVYETGMTSEQRQQALMIEDGVMLNDVP
jgi:hypothetical protein